MPEILTRPGNIMKIVGATMVERWRDQIDSAKTLKRLAELLEWMQSFTVLKLSPALMNRRFFAPFFS